jgi:hypothetical protein
VTSGTSNMVEKLHSQLPLGAEAAHKAQHYQEVIQDLKAMLHGKWVAKVHSKGSVSTLVLHAESSSTHYPE